MKLAIVLTAFLLGGCSVLVPVSKKFPEAPKELLELCPEKLETLGEKETSILVITKTVSKNYQTYYECRVKHSEFVDWYKDQKKNFDKK